MFLLPFLLGPFSVPSFVRVSFLQLKPSIHSIAMIMVAMHLMPFIIAHVMMSVASSSLHTFLTVRRLIVVIPAIIIAALIPFTRSFVVISLLVALDLLSSLLCAGIG